MSNITWYGHAAFGLECSGVRILIDPFFADPQMAALAEKGGVDLILITHDHGDHTGDVAGIAQRTKAGVGAILLYGKTLPIPGT